MAARGVPPYRQWAEQYFPHYLQKPWSRMHAEFAAAFDRLHHHRGQRRCWVAPRSGAKTTHVAKLYPLYAVCHDLERYIILAGATAGQAIKNLSAIKSELEHNLALRRDYPDVCGVGQRWNDARIVTRNGVCIEAIGRGCRIRGATHGQYRPGLIIGDDLDDLDSIATDDSRQKAWDWLTRVLIPLGLEEQANVLVCGTALHPKDITRRCHDAPGWRFRAFPSLIREPENQGLWREWAEIYSEETRQRNDGTLDDDDSGPAAEFYAANRSEMDAGALLLWPEQESLYDLQVYRQRNGEASFQAEKQGNPFAVSGTEWPLSCFDDRVRFSRWPQCSLRAMVCDPSKGATERSDYSAWVWGGVGPDGLIYVDADLQRRDAKQICDDGAVLAKAFRPHAVGMETDAYGAIEKLWWDSVQQAEAVVPDLRVIGHGGVKKTVRIRRLTEYLRGYRFRFRAASAGAELLLEQLRDFPHGRHDDGPDALEMLLRLLQALSDGRDGAADDGPQESWYDLGHVEA